MSSQRTQLPPILRAEPINGLALTLIALLALIGLSLAAKVALESGLSWRCPVVAIFNVPCPSCGGTRAFAALSELRFLDALQFNPLLVAAIPLGLIGSLFRGFLKRYERFGWSLLAATVAANWVYLYL